MDQQLLRLYQSQVVYCCKAILLGGEDIERGLAERSDYSRIWYGVQNLIIGAGNLSKTLWGAKRFRDARQPLRDSLGITDASPLRRIDIRNDYEHLDERIEEWWEKSENHNVIDSMIGPRGSTVGFGDQDVLRWLDPSTGDVIFWGNELNIPTIVEEAKRILPVAEAEHQKPHGRARSSGGGQ